MKTKYMCILSVTAGALLSGCVVEPNGQVGIVWPTVEVAQPIVVAQPVVEPEPVVAVPETYVWDGIEYVGVVGDQYFYLGDGNVWIVCDPVRLGRFHEWEGGHRDWRDHAIRNERFRNDNRGREHGEPQRAAPKKKKDEH